MNFFDIKTALRANESVESGYGVDYTFTDVICEVDDLNSLLNDVLVITDRYKKITAFDRLNSALEVALTAVAIEVHESFDDVPEPLKVQG